MLLAAVETVLAAHGVERRGDEVVIVACSGGVDSVVLAHACVTVLGARRVVIAHVDHGVRDDAGDDAAWVERYAKELNAEFHRRSVHAASDAEAVLRELRYGALEDIRETVRASWILTAHNQNDQAEQVMIALLRSGHPEALSGIPNRRQAILRPMLEVPRRVIVTYAEKHRLSWREDPTNREPRYLRNRVRKELLPLIDRLYRPGIVRRLAALATNVSKRDESADGPSSARIAESRPAVHPVAFARRAWTGGQVPDGRQSAVFDADRLESFLVRPLRDGDRIRPFGHSGRRKVRDILREGGIGVDQRDRVWLVESEGEVVWVPGLLRANRAPVAETTQYVWVFWTAETSELQAGESRATLLGGPPTGGPFDRNSGP